MDIARPRAPASVGDAAEPVRYSPGLDGIRAVAVFLVIAFHAWPQLAPSGALGVDMFFALSGFLITSLLLGEHRRFGSVSVARFYARRALRLLPALGVVIPVALGLAFAIPALGVAATAREALAASAYVSNWLLASYTGSDFGRGLLPHTWSLAVEEQFYLVWPIALIVLLRLGGIRTALWVTLAAVAALVVHRVMYLQSGAPGAAIYVYYRTDTHGDGLLVGCAAALAMAGLSARSRRWAGPTAVMALAVLLACAFGGVERWSVAAPVFPALGYTFIAVVSVALIAGVATAPRSLIAKALGTPWLVAAGRRSYGYYLWHYPVFFGLVGRLWGVGPGPAGLAVTLLVTVVAAGASYRYVESPCLRLKSRFAAAPPSARAGAALITDPASA